jgi:hypothetical protein
MAAAGIAAQSALAFGDVTDFTAMGEMIAGIAKAHGPVESS